MRVQHTMRVCLSVTRTSATKCESLLHTAVCAWPPCAQDAALNFLLCSMVSVQEFEQKYAEANAAKEALAADLDAAQAKVTQ
eukprot:scaffold227584_cov21-Tisochrysis_lutea.AAC.1